MTVRNVSVRRDDLYTQTAFFKVANEPLVASDSTLCLPPCWAGLLSTAWVTSAYNSEHFSFMAGGHLRYKYL